MSKSISNIAEFRAPGDNNLTLEQADLQALTRLLADFSPYDGKFDLIHGIHIVKNSKIEDERTFVNSLPSICIVPQGAKSVSFANGGFEYDESKMVVYAAEIPINVKITKASKDNPYYCLVLPIDLKRLNDLIVKVFPNGIPKAEKTRALYVGDSNPEILKSAIRIMDLIKKQEDIDLLVPLAMDEILVRLLRSPVGRSLAQIGITDSHADKITKAITWLQSNYKQPIKVDELAKTAGMSLSSFHIHFKDITGMSPLQFQKTLRLQEARNLIRGQALDVSTAAFEVGYASSTQFSREYSRMFGVSPSRDTQV